MFRSLSSLLMFFFIGTAGWYFWKDPELRRKIITYVENAEIWIMESRFTVDQILQKNQRELLTSKNFAFKGASVSYYPYLMMEVKYSKSREIAKEGILLWSLVNGEMVLDTNNWEITHGLGDAIQAQATSVEMKLLNILFQRKGSLSLDKLYKELAIERKACDEVIEAACKKSLIVRRGDIVYLYFNQPKFGLEPETRIGSWIVPKPHHSTKIFPRQYSRYQIERMAKVAFFEKNLVVRSAKEIYLPVYSIEVQDDHGVIYTSYWNALTGHSFRSSLGLT